MAPSPSAQKVLLLRHVISLMVAWTAILAGLLACVLWDNNNNVLKRAEVQAAAGIDRDRIWREWNGSHGGVYVPVTADTPPNPYLVGIAERDIVTPSGRKLTLVNPAYMTRQVYESATKHGAIRGHLTSLNPRRPENKPDAWEAQTLKTFESGQDTNVTTVTTLDGQLYLRSMTVLNVTKGCLKCHATQGYKVGDVRGGISMSLPLAPFVAAGKAEAASHVMVYGVVWLIGLAGIALACIAIGQRGRRCQQAEDAVRRNQTELVDTNLLLETAIVHATEMAVQAEKGTVAKSEFLANMSHEIRTPLTAILGYSELLMEEGLPSSDRLEHTRVIMRNGRHLLELINDILDISKIEADKLVLEQRACSVHAIVADVTSMMRVRAIEKHLALTARYTTPMPRTIITDEARLRQALINLVGNAIKFTQTGEVNVSIGLVPGQLNAPPVIRMAVRDTGIGMSAEAMGNLFQPFVQADSSTTRKFGGTGLGLTITKRIVGKMGGEVLVESTPGQGSTFTMLVPTGSLEGIDMVEQTAEAMAETVESPLQPERTLPLQGLRILLAEDGPDNQVLIRTVLTKAGAEVEVVENGLLAVQAATQRSFDLVLMDMQMPEMDGYQAATRLRAQGYGVPVVALTAHALSSDRGRCLEAGCTDYLTKPIQRAAMIALILKHTSKQEMSVDSFDALAQEPTPPAADAIVSEFADDPDMAEIIVAFVGLLWARVADMRQALTNGDWDSLRRSAHQMKGAGGGYGYSQLTDEARELETLAKQKDVEGATLSLNRLAALCRRIEAGCPAGGARSHKP